MRKKMILSGICVIMLIGVIATRVGHYDASEDGTSSGMRALIGEYTYKEDISEEKIVKVNDTANAEKPKEYIEVDTNPESYTVLVNREHLLPKDYIPADLVVPNISFSYRGTYEKSYMRKRAADALEQLFAAAWKKNYRLYGVSAYRSYERQDQIYRNNVRNRGSALTDQVSAVPGSSEHQTGLAIDVSCSSVNCALEESFGMTPEGEWLKRNAHKFGFIIRYPRWRERVTGYSYEPWHIRYVGKNLAKYIYQKKITLEEYYQLTTVDEQVKGEPVSDIDVNEESGPEMSSPPTPRPMPSPSASSRSSSAPQTRPTSTPDQLPKKTEEPEEEKTDPEDEAEEEPEKTEAPKATKKPDTEKVTPTKNPVPTEAPATPVPEEPSQEEPAPETPEGEEETAD